MVTSILEVSVERMFALTPLPSPSASTQKRHIPVLTDLYPVAAEFLARLIEGDIARLRAQIICH